MRAFSLGLTAVARRAALRWQRLKRAFYCMLDLAKADVTSAHFLSNRKLVIFIYVIISCTKVAWIKQMLHLCGLANVLPAEHRYPNQRWPSATAPNGYSSTAANCLMLATTPWLNLNKS